MAEISLEISDLKEGILRLTNLYDGINDEEIENALEIILDKHKVLVLVDSLDYYDITEKKVVTISKALVELEFLYYRMYKEQNILLKAAIPSEVYTHVLEQIPAKRKTKVVAIEWRYKDLIKMLAIKVFFYFDSNKYEFSKDYVSQYELEDFLTIICRLIFCIKCCQRFVRQLYLWNLTHYLIVFDIRKRNRGRCSPFSIFLSKKCVWKNDLIIS